MEISVIGINRYDVTLSETEAKFLNDLAVEDDSPPEKTLGDLIFYALANSHSAMKLRETHAIYNPANID